MKKCLFLFAALVFSCSLFAQPKYENIDNDVKKFGDLATLNVARIADTITLGISGKEDQARAIFYWIANNIAIDPKAVKQNDNKNTLPETVIELRKANALGFSLLFQEMCSHVNIRCLSVDGFIKYSAGEINEKADEKNHSWNVVQLGQSPETWYYVDAYAAAGYLDKKMTLFTKQFTGQYFFTERQLFNLAYYPDNEAWQLGQGPKSLKDFYALPILGAGAFDLGLRKPTPEKGYIKTKVGAPVVFSFGAVGEHRAKDVSLIIGDDKRQLKPEPMDFDDNGATVRFTYKFKKEDTFPVKIVADGREVLQYMVEVNE